MQVIVFCTDVSPVGCKQLPLARIARVVFEFIYVQVYIPLFHLHMCFPFRRFQDEFGLDRIELARTRNEPIALFLLQVNSNDVLTVTKSENASIKGTKFNNSSRLIGVISRYLPYEDVAISAQTRKPRIIFQENSGLATVVPVDVIQETVDLAVKKLRLSRK